MKLVRCAVCRLAIESYIAVVSSRLVRATHKVNGKGAAPKQNSRPKASERDLAAELASSFAAFCAFHTCHVAVAGDRTRLLRNKVHFFPRQTA